ncbi:MAG: GTPase HflX [Clostridia bacterium]|nr:GTPase HflX [Lachnospiraceae bacterium]NCB99745.1 GTPase HflX [Clostridia bacterium]NCD01684.1 GTPase HflX [Clostridia bacterium]
MAEVYETKELDEKVILVGVSSQDGEDTEQSLDELEELARTAGAQTVGRLIQNREAPHPGTYLGKGKIEELKELIWELDATGIICDDELSPAQLGNLQDMLETKVMDRTLIILDIFAQRASTREGKIQVELAQLRYRSTRLTGLGKSLSRLGGGIGTRGPGEKKLEIDRRLIRDRISQLKQELDAVKRHREVARQQRSRNQVPVVAIVGYTNAGKSTLLNQLTGAGVLEEDKLFATLDPTTRNLKLDSGQEILLTDTVGFIRKLPHHLINAFRSTLEEAKYADIILHVVDASNPQMDIHMYVVYDTLTELEVGEKPIITLFNKVDRLEEGALFEGLRDFRAEKTLQIAAKKQIGLDAVKEALEEILRESKVLIERVFDYNRAGDIAVIRKYGQLLEEEYRPEGIFVRAYVPKDVYAQLEF